MTKNRIPKPPKESTATGQPQRTSLWKRLGRRGSNSSSQTSAPPGEAIPLKSIRHDDGKGGGKSGLFRKLKGSFRSTTTGSSSEPVAKDHNQLTTSSRPNSSSFSVGSYATAESNLEGEEKKELEWIDVASEKRQRERIYQKQQIKELDGFCRRVDTYDGQVIVVDKKPTYEIGNYLGGGVAGVVYEGHRLRPKEEYPVRRGISEERQLKTSNEEKKSPSDDDFGAGGFFCGSNACGTVDAVDDGPDNTARETRNDESQIVVESSGALEVEEDAVAIEATMSYNETGGVMLDAQDAPSRSKHYTKAAAVPTSLRANSKKPLEHGLSDEAVAIKILNPVGYRILQADSLKDCVIVRNGQPMDREVQNGTKPMEERHVWWLVNPNSRNLTTLQRYNGKDKNSTVPKGLQIDRGSAKRGLRLSLIAAYIDPKTGSLRELTLTRCIEIWGHIPFNASDMEFDDMMTAIERINAGYPPPPFPALDEVPGRIGTDKTDNTASTQTNSDSDVEGLPPVVFGKARTGLVRAAFSERVTVKCKELNAYIAIPAVPSKYLRWLRQRRAATKEIRNMMLIGRHKNVLHLFEVLEYVQDSKSTMFLVLELVKGGELFDLISSNAGKGNRTARDIEESEQMMRKFFFELSSGINYCHQSGIAHRDLKPENLLVHNTGDGSRILKIADFGLSAAFGTMGNNIRLTGFQLDSETLVDPSIGSPLSQNTFASHRDGNFSPSSQSSASSMKGSMDKMIASGVSALSFLTCGAMESVLCNPTDENNPSPLRRMTSVVGSPHYVAPEIIAQSDDNGSRKKTQGYDGSKADVWSAGVILYAMLFRSLPFGEDLLRCPRFQSYRKWYDDVRTTDGRRSSSHAALNPNISDSDERHFLGPHWFFPVTTSKESRDLIVAMLNPSPVDRLSIAQVLQHPWLLKEQKS